MRHEHKIAANRAVLRSKIRELQVMIANIEARADLGGNIKQAATVGLYETVADLEADFTNGWKGAWD